MGRAPCCDKTKVKKGPWSPDEDETLKNYLQKCGTGGNWIALPHKAGLKRCGKSCRLRWLNYLRPNIKHGGFTQEEDNIIFTLFSELGSRWSVIASQLPGRTDNDVKNHWNTKLKKKLMAAAATSNTTTNNNPNPSSISTFPGSTTPSMALVGPHTQAYSTTTTTTFSSFFNQSSPSLMSTLTGVSYGLNILNTTQSLIHDIPATHHYPLDQELVTPISPQDSASISAFSPVTIDPYNNYMSSWTGNIGSSGDVGFSMDLIGSGFPHHDELNSGIWSQDTLVNGEFGNSYPNLVNSSLS